MLEGINIESVKQYNATLRQYKDQSAKLTAEIEFNEKELNTLCSQLTTELGVQVTPENIESIYNEQVQKINQTLETGNAVLQKIQQEASGGVTPVTPVQAPQTPVIPAAPVQAPQSTANSSNQTSFVSAATEQHSVQTPIFTEGSSHIVDSLPNPNNIMNGTLNGGSNLFRM